MLARAWAGNQSRQRQLNVNPFVTHEHGGGKKPYVPLSDAKLEAWVGRMQRLQHGRKPGSDASDLPVGPPPPKAENRPPAFMLGGLDTDPRPASRPSSAVLASRPSAGGGGGGGGLSSGLPSAGDLFGDD